MFSDRVTLYEAGCGIWTVTVTRFRPRGNSPSARHWQTEKRSLPNARIPTLRCNAPLRGYHIYYYICPLALCQ